MNKRLIVLVALCSLSITWLSLSAFKVHIHIIFWLWSDLNIHIHSFLVRGNAIKRIFFIFTFFSIVMTFLHFFIRSISFLFLCISRKILILTILVGIRRARKFKQGLLDSLIDFFKGCWFLQFFVRRLSWQLLRVFHNFVFSSP